MIPYFSSVSPFAFLPISLEMLSYNAVLSCDIMFAFLTPRLAILPGNVLLQPLEEHVDEAHTYRGKAAQAMHQIDTCSLQAACTAFSLNTISPLSILYTTLCDGRSAATHRTHASTHAKPDFSVQTCLTCLVMMSNSCAAMSPLCHLMNHALA